VAHACNPSHLGGEIGRMVVQGQHGQTVCETKSQPIAGAIVCTCHPKLWFEAEQEDCSSNSAQAKIKFMRPIPMGKSWAWWLTPVTLAPVESVK
jgi:hypothetical protein